LIIFTAGGKAAKYSDKAKAEAEAKAKALSLSQNFLAPTFSQYAIKTHTPLSEKSTNFTWMRWSYYLTAEVLELTGDAAKELKVKRIKSRHLQLAIRGDEELDSLSKAVISVGGVIPNIHKSLLGKEEENVATLSQSYSF
ncbi:histone H2A.V-like, partial [Teleopsis dalmanni]|uniref:histone H2A.V-like n=1 Tax=Teleopsis dalmanni TaxID=139649 RepID=UPI0018CE9FB2